MCGIAGWQLAPGAVRDAAEVAAMAEALAHRGPDDRGTYFDEAAGVALAHRRLSIIDLSAGGHQPMIANDNSVVLAFNGELYNFMALKGELEALGHSFRSRS